MQIHHGFVRKAFTSLGIAGLLTGATLFIAPTASAAVSNDCSTTVTAKMGESVSVSGESVMEHVRKGAQDSGGLDNWFVLYDQLAEEIKAKGALKVGTVPDAATGAVSGTKIGTVVAQALKDSSNLGSNKEKTLSYIKSEVAEHCGLTLKASNYVPPASTTGTQSPGTSTPGTSENVPGVRRTPGFKFGTGDARAPRRDYGGLPFALPGATGAGQGGSLVPGAAPEFGGLPGTAAPEPVTNAGQADPLGGDPTREDIQLPMLLAAVALAGVASALMRTWVLRHHHS